ncbi:MAG: hypothetical protein ACHQ3P_05970 [Candidatus Limnocylindrales bacterium]
MIELMLQAERALSMGMVDRAEQLYWQAIETDSRNGIAIVGLAKIAIERGDDATALLFARKALEIDPDNGAAQRITKRLEEAASERGLPAVPATAVADTPVAALLADLEIAEQSATEAPAAEAATESPAAEAPSEPAKEPATERPEPEPAAEAAASAAAEPPPEAPIRKRPDVEWPAADLDQARRGTLPPIAPGDTGAGAGTASKGSVSDWPGADSAPKSSTTRDGGRDADRGRGTDRS